MGAPASAPSADNLVTSSPQQAAVGEVALTSAEAGSTGTALPTKPQLVKTAELSVTVDSVEETVRAVTAIVQQQQGDLLELQDQIPTEGNTHHTAQLQLRVPQANLDATLDALSKLGEVQQQTLTTEDVSNQLVDYQARLRNLRRTEEMLLDIMNRSGSVGDVLKVAQELSNVRSSIEQIDAQLKNLQNRVAYSNIRMSVREAIATPPTPPAAITQLQSTWQSATRSIGKVTVDLLQLGIWLMIYSPYLLILAGGVLVYRRSRQRTNTVRGDR